jgi:nucleotide-binding universal stress UspA family protein
MSRTKENPAMQNDKAAQGTPQAGPAKKSNITIQRILVPIDFSTESLKALTYATDLATWFGAEVLTLHVIEPTHFGRASGSSSAQPDLAAYKDAEWRFANADLEILGAELNEKGYRVQTMVQRGVPAQVIVDTATSTRADLIVMSTHGRTGLTHMLIGSVAEKVVRTAQCPVLTVRNTVRKRTATKRVARK